jgi:integrase/recombinase XerD
MNPTNWHKRYCVDSALKYPSKATQENYQSSVLGFLHYFQYEEDPSHIKTDSIKEWLLTFETINTRNHKLCAIKSFYEITVGMPLKLDKIPFSKKDKKLPEVLEEDEISAILSVCDNLKHKTIICLLYGCGLRISEVINLKLDHLKDTTIDIKLAKGRKDRIVPYPNHLKDLVDKYIMEYHPSEYLFNGQFPKKEIRYSERSINEFIKQLAVKAGITRRVHAHLFRHSWATHSLEQGVSLPFIQTILGHNNPKTTSIYLHTSRKSIEKIPSPLSNIL